MKLAAVLVPLALAACKDDQAQRDAHIERKAEWTQRAKRGPFVASSTQISQHETIKEVILPETRGRRAGDPSDDRRCVIYTNTAAPAATMFCESLTYAGLTSGDPTAADP